MRERNLFISVLFYYVAVIYDVFDFLVVLNGHGFGVDTAVDELDVLRTFHLDTVSVTHDHNLVKEDVVYGFSLESLDIHGLIGVDAGYIAEDDIGPVGEEGFLVVLVSCADACSAISIARLDEESGFLDILHDDIVAVYILAPAATSRS
jgi:hypothetical protein